MAISADCRPTVETSLHRFTHPGFADAGGMRLRSPTAIRHLAEDHAENFRCLVAANRAELDKHSNPPFAVLYQGELQ